MSRQRAMSYLGAKPEPIEMTMDSFDMLKVRNAAGTVALYATMQDTWIELLPDYDIRGGVWGVILMLTACTLIAVAFWTIEAVSRHSQACGGG